MTARLNRLAPLLLICAGTAQAEGYDILACAPTEKEAVTPTDTLKCEWKNGLFEATLAQLYGEGWRLLEAAFYDDTREVLYLERAIAVAAAP